MDIIKNKTNMTVEEASKLRNGHGKNLNRGTYVHASRRTPPATVSR